MARALRLDGVLLLAALACGREQHTSLFPPDAGASDGTGGGPAALDDGGVSDASVFEGAARDGGAGDAGDAGDAGGPLPPLDGRCVEGTLADFCVNDRCPSRQDALARLRADGAAFVVQRPCRGEDGTAFVSVGSSFLTNSGTYIYDAQSGELVSVYVLVDVYELCDERATDAFYGPVIPDCMFDGPVSVPSICYDYGGTNVTDAGLGRPTPDECVFVEE
jgi:hypothetical protein